MSHVIGGRGPWKLSAATAATFMSVMLAACGGTTTPSGTIATASLPRLSSSVQYNGVNFSVPPGFSFAQVDPAASTSGYMLDKPAQQGKVDCSGRSGWQATTVFFTSASNIEAVSSSLQPTTIDHGLSVEEDAASSLGTGCQYVTQHVVIPNLGVGMAISGDGVTASSALALAREIVASATPASSTASG